MFVAGSYLILYQVVAPAGIAFGAESTRPSAESSVTLSKMRHTYTRCGGGGAATRHKSTSVSASTQVYSRDAQLKSSVGAETAHTQPGSGSTRSRFSSTCGEWQANEEASQSSKADLEVEVEVGEAHPEHAVRLPGTNETSNRVSPGRTGEQADAARTTKQRSSDTKTQNEQA